MEEIRIRQRFIYLKWPLLVLISAGFLWLKSYGLHYTVGGDENAYFYMARLMSEGKLFYRDFFFAHPPLQLLLLALVYTLFGFNLLALKLTAVLPVLAGGGLLYLQFWKKKESLAGCFFLIVFLFSYELLKVTTHPFGLNLTAFFLIASLYFFLADRPLISGLFWGCASITGLYALPWGTLPCLYYLLRRDRYALLLGFLGGFLIIFGSVNGLFLLCFGDKYLTPVYIYHFLKPRGPELVADIYLRVLRRNILIFFLPFLYAWTPRTAKRTTVLGAALMYLVLLGGLNPLFTQYFMLPIPFLAWIGAVSLAGVVRRFPAKGPRRAAGAAAVMLLLVFSADDVRRYIPHEKGTGFETADQCREFILQNSTADDLLFGHVTTVPLLALMTGRAIALDMVDTNYMRFKAGLADIGETMEKLAAEPRLKFIIIQESRFWLDPRVQSYLSRYQPVAVFNEPRERIIFYDCRKK